MSGEPTLDIPLLYIEVEGIKNFLIPHKAPGSDDVTLNFSVKETVSILVY